MTRILFTSVFLMISAAGCASSGTKPDDMSAAQHRGAAADKQAKADEHAKHHDVPAAPNPSPSASGVVPGVNDLYFDTDVYNPTAKHALLSESYQNLADAHLAAARELETFEEKQCKSLPSATRSHCPLLGAVAKVSNIDGGVRLVLEDGANQAAVLAHIQCHFAYGRSQGHEGMDACPLYLKGVNSTEGEGVISLTTANAEEVDELRARAATHAGH